MSDDPFGLEKLTRSTSIGFDDIIRRLSNIGSTFDSTTPGWPPYNIRKSGDNMYVLEMAVAGFSKNDIEITTENDVLTIKGNISASTEDNFIHRGIAKRNFHRRFTLANTIKVNSSTMSDGMLRVFLEKIIPEDKKVQRIEIK